MPLCQCQITERDVTEVEKKWKEHASEDNSSPHDKPLETSAILHSQASIHNHLLPSLSIFPSKTKAFETARSVSFLPWALATRHSMDPIALHAAFVEVRSRVTGIVASYHQGIIGNHRHCHQGPGLVDFQASERLEDEIAEPMELASLWCLGFTISEGLMVHACHVDTCWCCWKNLVWSFWIIFESSWWLSLVVWLFGCLEYPKHFITEVGCLYGVLALLIGSLDGLFRFICSKHLSHLRTWEIRKKLAETAMVS